MSFVPHTEGDVALMLDTIGIDDISDLFDSIPENIRLTSPIEGLPGPLDELELTREFERIAASNRTDLICFAGGGAYDSLVPAVVKAIGARPEFATAYTPYQAEFSQGVLQALFEYQTLICRLTGMDVANASLYDGASALAEAVALATAATGRNRVVISKGVNPRYRKVLATLASGRNWEISVVDIVDGITQWQEIPSNTACLILQHPNYLGHIEDVRCSCALARDAGALCLVVTDPIANGILKNPGSEGADVVVAEGQSLGMHLNFGGPYLGMFATREEYVRYVPGRIVGETLDADGKRCYALALQAREQHIRREKASSNICTNQTLMAIMAAATLCWLGPQGLREIAVRSALRAHYMAEELEQVSGCCIAAGAPFFREFALRLPQPADEVLEAMANEGFLAGVALGDDYPELGEAILIAVTEKRTRQEIDRYIESLKKVIGK